MDVTADMCVERGCMGRLYANGDVWVCDNCGAEYTNQTRNLILHAARLQGKVAMLESAINRALELGESGYAGCWKTSLRMALDGKWRQTQVET